MRILTPSEIRKVSTEVNIKDEEIIKFIDDLLKISIKSLGIAAPQIGLFKNLFAVNFGQGPIIMANPEITNIGEGTNFHQEGCLSFPNTFLNVERPSEVEIKYTDVGGEKREAGLIGIEAAVFLHEYDHLKGILFIDRATMNRGVRRKIERKFRVEVNKVGGYISG